MGIRRNIVEGRNPLLELCPFCGEPGEIFCVPQEQGCRVRCSNPECPFRPSSANAFPIEELAIKAWNSRKGMPSIGKNLGEAMSRPYER